MGLFDKLKRGLQKTKDILRTDVRDLFKAPRHPYTQALLSSIPRLGAKEPLYAIPGQPPDLSDPPAGCAFHPRCPYAWEQCRVAEPPETNAGPHHLARCWMLHSA